MPPLPRRAVLSGLLVGALVGLTAAGCGSGGLPSSTADTGRGQQLFMEKCGTCHALKGAGTNGTIGPNLDDAFGPGLEQGFSDSTVRAIVADQIRYPGREKITENGAIMPADLVTGDDVDNVAAFVAQAVQNPSAGGGGGGGKITATGGKEIFTSAGCSGCHTLADAGSTGTVGPNLDQAKPSKSLAVERVTNGAGAMPSFKDRLSKQQIDAVADYVSSVAGK